MNTFINIYRNNTTQNGAQGDKSSKKMKMEDMSVEKFYKLMDQQKSHTIFMKGIDSLIDEERIETIKKSRR